MDEERASIQLLEMDEEKRKIVSRAIIIENAHVDVLLIQIEDFLGVFGELVAERLGCEDLHLVAVCAELLDEIESGCYEPFEDIRLDFPLGMM